MEQVKVIKMNDRGQIVLPIEFRKKLGLTESTTMMVRIMDDGGLEIRAASIVPRSNYLQHHAELHADVVESYRQAKEGKVFNAQETKKLFEEK